MRSAAAAMGLALTVVDALGLYAAPELADRWIRSVVLFWLFFAAIEGVTRSARGPGTAQIVRWHWASITVVGVVLMLRAATRVAWNVGLIDGNAAVSLVRTRGVLVGLAALAWGNYLPKLVSPWSRAEEPFDWQGVHRFVGRVGTVWGVSTVFAWLFLPAESAQRMTVAVTVVVAVLCVARKWGSVAAYAVRGGPART